jgi:hypothetical protein
MQQHMMAAAAGAPYGTPMTFHPAYYAHAAMAAVNPLSQCRSVLVLQLECEIASWAWFCAECSLHGRRARCGGGREVQEEELRCSLRR